MFTLVRTLLLICTGCITAMAQQTLFYPAIDGYMQMKPDGSAQYNITLALPPGNTGATPQLSLAYSSQRGNGLTGMGWSLTGLSAITRTGATVPQDGFRGGVNYDGNDRFLLDGARLINTTANSAYGSPGNVFFPELQNWSKVTANGTSARGPATFTVQEKDGTVLQYATQVPAQGSVFTDSLQGSVRKWLLSSETAPTGNTILYKYTTTPKNLQNIPMAGSAADGTSYPDAIMYGTAAIQNRMVCFRYEPRPDTILQYSGGAGFQLSVRLKAIQTFLINGADTTPVSTWLLNYDTTSPLNVSRLAGIVQLGRNGSPGQPTTFTWSNGATGLVPAAAGWTGPGTNSGYQGDFNGDGRTDLMPVSGNTVSAIWLSTGSGFSQQNLSAQILLGTPSFVSDFNGDGLPDVLTVRGGAGQLYYGNGSGFNTGINSPTTVTTGGNCQNCAWAADFNGDGMADLFTLAGSAGYLYLANGTGFSSQQTIPGLNIQGQVFVADVNGDGQADLFSGGQEGGSLYLSDFSNSKSFRPPVALSGMTISNTPQNNLLADYNSDGLADLLTITGGQYNLYYSTGQGFSAAVPINNLQLNNTQNWLSDFNGDGRMDFYTYNGINAIIYYYSGGDFFPQSGSAPPLLAGDTWTGDFNGDGIADLFSANMDTIYFGGNAAAGITPGSNQVAHLLTGISNGINGTHAMQYAPITNPMVYTPLNTSGGLEELRTQNQYGTVPLSPSQLNPYPYVHTQSARYVVQRYAWSDGMGNSYPAYFKYAGSLTDLEAYGWLGFQQVTKTDSSAGNIITSTYNQFFPLTGRPAVENKSDLYGNLLQAERSSYLVVADTFPSPSSVNYAVLLSAARKDHYDYGNFTYTTGENFVYDSFSNMILLQQLNDTAETGQLFTRNTYTNDTAGWHIGYRTGSTMAADSGGTDLLRAYRFGYDPLSWLPVSKQYWLNTSNTWLSEAYAFDAAGNRTMLVDFAGDTAYYAYDSIYSAFPVSQTAPPNQWGVRLTNTLTQDPAFGRTTSLRDANGNQLEIALDQFGRDSVFYGPDTTGGIVPLNYIRYIPGSTAGFTRQKILRTNWAGTVWDTTSFSCDGMGRNVQKAWQGTAGQTVLLQKSYNSQNQLVMKSLPFFEGDSIAAINYQYDPYQRVTGITFPGAAGQQVLNTYTYAGKSVTLQKAAGTADSATSVRLFDYFNGKKKTVQRTDETGLITQMAYDPLGLLSNVTDPAGLATKYIRNSLGDMVVSVNPAAGQQQILRNYTSKNYTVVNNAGDSILYQQDALRRLISVNSAAGLRLYQYDVPGVRNGLGNLCRIVLEDTSIQYNYAYDAFRHTEDVELDINGHAFSTNIQYNPDGKPTSIQYPDSSAATYNYYSNGYLSQTIYGTSGDSAAAVLTYSTYDASGNELQVNYGNGTARTASFSGFSLLNGYRITGPQGAVLASKEYSWSPLFRVTAILDSLSPANSMQYQYALNGRLDSSWGPSGAAAFRYDAAGNLLQMDSLQYTYNNRYQVVSGTGNSGTTYAAGYDANGNMLWRTLYANGDSTRYDYAYNVFNQLISVLNNRDTLFNFTYNHNGQRILKQDHSQNVTTAYISPQYILNLSPAGNTAERYVCSPAEIFVSMDDTDTIYLHQNYVNSTELSTNNAAQPTASYSYAQFGQLVSAGTDTARFLFGSKELDEGGLYYFNARYYDPATGRFITADDRAGGQKFSNDVYNRYAYALNDPVTSYDPSGHFIGLLLQLIISAVDIVGEIASGGILTAELAELDAIAEGADSELMTSEEAKFMRGLQNARVNNEIDSDTRAKGIFNARQEIEQGRTFQERTINNEFRRPMQILNLPATPGQDAYGNAVYMNRSSASLGEELVDGQEKIESGEAEWENDPQAIGQKLQTHQSYKFVLGFDDFTLRIGTEELSHAAVEGQGEWVYTAGYAQLDDENNLILTNQSGHYQPSMNSLQTSAPLWRMLNNEGYLDFNAIQYRSYR